jgi:hypothetical protein
MNDDVYMSDAVVISKSTQSVKINGILTETKKITLQGRAGKGKQFSDKAIVFGG